MSTPTKYKRVLLKLSGEALMGSQDFGLDAETVDRIAEEIKSVHENSVQVCLVIGAGNIFRGVSLAAANIERTTGDYMGMLATVLNALAMQSMLESKGVSTRVLSAIPMASVCEPYIRRRAVRHMEKGRVVIFAAGTGNPYMTTDTASALRALEINADVLLMAKNNVDGVYDSDPNENSDAVRFGNLDYMDALNMRLDVMDSTALSLCMDNQLPIVVFNIFEPGTIGNILTGQTVGTLITARD